MAITFIYNLNPESLILAIFNDLTLIVANLLIIRASKQQGEEVSKVNLLKLIGIINITMLIFVRFLPTIKLQDFSPIDYQIFKCYHLFESLSIVSAFILTFGVYITLFGRYNEKRYLVLGGLLMLFTYTIKVVTDSLYFGVLIDDLYLRQNSAQYNPIWIIYSLLTNISLTSYILGLTLFIVHCKLHRDNTLLYAVLLIIFQEIGKNILFQIF